MRRALTLTAILITSTFTVPVSAQPPDSAIFPGDERPRHSRGREDRLQRMADYLELSDSQNAEWQAISERHLEAVRTRWDRVESLRENFVELADQHDPNLQQLGRISLDLHREIQMTRDSRGTVIAELEQILTPEQAEKFAALQVARDFAGERGHRRARGPRARQETD